MPHLCNSHARNVAVDKLYVEVYIGFVPGISVTKKVKK